MKPQFKTLYEIYDNYDPIDNFEQFTEVEVGNIL